MAKYLKQGTEHGYVEDVVEIDKLKFENISQVAFGCMLGDFNNAGEYVVESEIVKELIEMPKRVVDVMENIEICQSFLKLRNNHS